MEQRKGFTLIELLVVIAIIALLMSILMPALTRVKDQAKNSVCMSNLHQFAIVWKMYLDENKNKFPENNEDWVFFTESLWKDENLLLCPYASKLKIPATRDDIRGGPHHAWSDSYNGRRVICSYGLNQYCSSDAAGGRDWNELIPNATIAQASRVPLMLDSSRYANTPQEHDIPPEWDGQIYTSNPSDVDEIRGFCINRHTVLFLDWSVRRVGLKKLWILKWKKDWNLPPEPLPEWPPWMAALRDPI